MAIPRIISLEFCTAGRDDGYFRILAESGVKYITVQAGALDDDSLMDMPLSFQDILPALPSGQELPAVETVWHQNKVDFLHLERTRQLTLLAEECTIKSGTSPNESPPENHGQNTMIAKIARFHWEIQYIEAETSMYQYLQSSKIGPRFLGHVHEEGRVIGFLLEKVQGRRAGIADLDICQRALQRLHDLGVLHGDFNRHDFIVGPDHEVVLIDFDKAVRNADAESLAREMVSLEEQLTEETGRGGGFFTDEE